MAVSGGAVMVVTPAAAQAPQRGATPPPSPQAIERARQIVADARKAMGGDKLDTLQTLVATGRTQRVRGNNLVPIEFELAIERPDKYVRKDEVPAEESGPTTTGFTGDEIIQTGASPGRSAGAGRSAGPVGSGGAPGTTAAPAAPTPEQLTAQNRARLVAAYQEFTRLSLGLLLDSLPAYPVRFAFAAEAAAPQGTADVLDVTAEGNFAARLFLNHDTHLPIMVSWQAPPASVILTTPGQPPPATVPPGAVSRPLPLLLRRPHRRRRRTPTRRPPMTCAARRRPGQSNTGCITRTTGTWMASSSRSGSVAPLAPTPPKRPRSTGSA